MTIQWSLVLFTVLSGCGAGLFACTALDEFRGGAASKVRLPACAVAVALLVVGGIASATHLSHVDRMMAVLAHPTAGIFLEALLLGLLAVCIAVYALLAKDAVYLPVYRALLEFAAECPRDKSAIDAVIDPHPLVQNPRLFAGYFLGELERIDAMEWADAWHVTERGLDLLEALRDGEDDESGVAAKEA